MADDVTLNAGSGGDTIAADDIAGVKHQRVKIVLGANNTSDGDVATGNPMPVAGNVAHDGSDSGSPVKIGARAIAHGTNPTAVAAADRTDLLANRAGVLWTIGGHPNIITATYNTTAAGTDDPVIAVVGSGTKIAVTRVQVTLDEACTVGVAVRMGFGAANVPALGASQADGVAGILCYHPGLVPGGGLIVGNGGGILGVGGDGEDLRITNEVPTGGTLGVTVSYFTIES